MGRLPLRVGSAVRGLALVSLLLLMAGCGESDRVRQEAAAGDESMSVIRGQVFYRERMMLPPGSEIEVQLQDISRADAMATVMASVMLDAEGGHPYDFAIDYDPARVDPRMRYALRATISRGERLLFTTTDYIDPFAGGDVEVLVRLVAEPVSREVPALEDTVWVLETLGGEPAPTGANGRPVDFQLLAEEGRVGGFSGCNRYTGSYDRDGVAARGSPLSFGPLAGTMMACEEGSELEQRYLKALVAVTAFRLDGGGLALLAGDDVVATFQPR
jgi:putative lipoprotein